MASCPTRRSVLGGLVAKRGRLAGHMEPSRREVQRLAVALTHLAACWTFPVSVGIAARQNGRSALGGLSR